MQNFDPISTKATLRDSRGLLVNNDRTVMSCSAGSAYPALHVEQGMLCYRTDLKKLYLLQDVALKKWTLLVDLNKTPVDKEYVDQELAKLSSASHNHDTRYYTKAASDARYYTKEQSNLSYLTKTAKAADADKLDGLNSTSFVRGDVESTITAHMRFGDNKELRFGASAAGRIMFDGGTLIQRNTAAGASAVFDLTKSAGTLARCITMTGGAAPYVSLHCDGAVRLKTDTAGVHVTGRLYATGDIVSASDARLKTNVITVASALNRVNQCRGVEFDMNRKRYYGVIAQELEAIFPHAVVELDNKEKTKAVNYSSLAGVLIEAIKELTDRLKKLEASTGK